MSGALTTKAVASSLVRHGVQARTVTACKTVGSAYVGSNPTPATTSENGPRTAETRSGGRFLLVTPCIGVRHRESMRCGVHGRIADGARAARTVGAHRRLFRGRPRTGRAGGVFPGLTHSSRLSGSGAEGETIAVRAAGGVVRVDVTDRGGRGVPQLRPSGDEAEGVRGLGWSGLGRTTCRRKTAISWRSTGISASLATSLRAGSASQPSTRTINR